MSQVTFRAEVDPEKGARILIARHIRAFNLARQPRMGDGKGWALYLEDAGGEVVGGLWGDMTLDWFYVELLVVPEALRGQGLGRQLLERAEQQARDWSAKGIWLTTFGFQARPFYEAHGFECFGTLPGAKADADEHFMRKFLN